MTQLVLIGVAVVLFGAITFISGYHWAWRRTARHDASHAMVCASLAITMLKTHRTHNAETLDSGLETLAKCELLLWKWKLGNRAEAELERRRRSDSITDQSFVSAYDHMAPELARIETLERQAKHQRRWRFWT